MYRYVFLNTMGMKVKTTLNIDRDVIKRAKEVGINISQLCENALKEAIRRLEAPYLSPNPQQPLQTASELQNGALGQDRTGDRHHTK